MTTRASNRVLKTGCTGLLFAGAAVFAIAAPANAVTEAADIVAACEEQPVCLYDGASISDPSSLASALPQNVRVVVIPQPDQAESVQSTTLAAKVRELTGTGTIILIEDHPGADRFAVASKSDQAKITESLYSQGESDGGTAVLSVASSLNSTESEVATVQETPGFDGGVIVAAVAALITIGAIVGGIMLVVRRRSKRARGRAAGSRRLEKITLRCAARRERRVHSTGG